MFSGMRSFTRLVVLMAVFLISAPALRAQAQASYTEDMSVRYRVAKAYLDRKYMNNREVLNRIVEWTDKVQKDSMLNIVSVEFGGAVSPEGSVPFNHWLSVARMNTLEKYVRRRFSLPEDIITRCDNYIAWDELKEMVQSSDLPNKDEIMAVLNSENTSVGNQLDSRIAALKALDNGKTWKIIFNRYFIHMRNAYITVVVERSAKFHEYMNRLKVAPLPGITTSAKPMTDIAPVFPVAAAAASSLVDTRYMYVKTNLVGLGLLMANAGVEFDLGRYLSFNLPVYYSAVNYFTPTVKFRTLATQPELRVWPMTNKDGLFLGAHMGFAYYNFAFDSDYRYQDHDGKTPTLGGGLTLGYRIPISKNKNWKLEFGVGAGVYPLTYDLFENLPNVKEGQLFETRNNTYIGIDNVQIGISYRIPIKKTIL